MVSEKSKSIPREDRPGGDLPTGQGASAGGRLPYAPPRLEVLGDVRDLTLGGTPGLGDSGNPMNFQAPTTKQQ